MRLLLIHADRIEYEAKGKTKFAEEIDESAKKGEMDEVLTAFISIESIDEKNPEEVADKAIDEIRDVAQKVKADNVMLYPYAHLSDDLGSPETSMEVLKNLELGLKEEFNVNRAPFGWYKSFEISCKGHPLSELSRRITPSEEKEKETTAIEAEEKAKSSFYILDLDGDLHSSETFNFSEHKNLEKFYIHEFSKRRTSDKVPPHVPLMRREEIADYEPASDPGNMRYYPKGRLIKSLLEEYVLERCMEDGAMEVETPIMYDTAHPALKEYLKRFPARQYEINSDKKRLFLRFSACFGQFLMNKDMTISYRNLPLKMVEMTRYSFRKEKRGELTGLRRLRSFTMPDMHTICYDMREAMEEFKRQYRLSMDLLDDIGLKKKDYEVAIRFTREFYDENKEFIRELVETIKKPVLIEIWEERFFYFVLKFEFNFIDALDKASALSTVQIDVENAERYGIKFVDKDGSDKFPIILHCSPSGAIERVMYALLEKGTMEDIPTLPTWLSPTQMRIIPVKGEDLDYAEEIYEKIKMSGIRGDIDDRNETLGRKIRDAEMEWIPYIAVIGDREKKNRNLSVTMRKKGERKKINIGDLLRIIKSETEDLPMKRLSLPYKLSMRAKFV